MSNALIAQDRSPKVWQVGDEFYVYPNKGRLLDELLTQFSYDEGNLNTLTILEIPGDTMLTFAYEQEDASLPPELVTKTAADFAKENGNGYLAGEN